MNQRLATVPPDYRLPWAFDESVLEIPDGEARLWEATHATLIDADREASLLFAIIAVCDAWDSAFRRHGLFDGSVYLASSDDIFDLVSLTSTADPEATPEQVDLILARLFAVELVYRFPVALKFRGEFGAERQARLNCWGRRLAERLRAQPEFADALTAIDGKVDAHLAENRAQYLEHMRLLAHLADYPPGTAWRSAADLPVGVLF